MTQLQLAIDPTLVPRRTLANGAKIPVIGLGTFGSDHVSGAQIAATVLNAAKIGYRQFDCASVYGNESRIGDALKSVWNMIAPRKEFWITSKLWNDKHAAKDVVPSCKQSLRDLKLEYLDLYLVHWPFPNFHPPGCDMVAALVQVGTTLGLSVIAEGIQTEIETALLLECGCQYGQGELLAQPTAPDARPVRLR